MFSTKNTNKTALVNDLVKNTCIMVAVHLMTKNRANAKFFDEDSLYSILFTLLAFVFYHVVFVNVVPPLA